MSNKKLILENLTIQSFVTALRRLEGEGVKGGSETLEIGSCIAGNTHDDKCRSILDPGACGSVFISEKCGT